MGFFITNIWEAWLELPERLVIDVPDLPCESSCVNNSVIIVSQFSELRVYVQHVIVMIDSRLVSEPCGASILTCLNTSGVRYEVGEQIQPYIITFSREQATVKESEAKKVSCVLMP